MRNYWLLALIIVMAVLMGFWGYSLSSSPRVTSETAKGIGKTIGVVPLSPNPAAADKSALPKPGVRVPNEKERSAPLPPQLQAGVTQPPEEILNGLRSTARRGITQDLSSADFFRALSETDQRAIITALTDAETSRMALLQESASLGQPPDAARMKATHQSADQAVRDLVGADVFSEYQGHMRNKPHRMIVNRLNDGLEEPLEQSSSQALILILAEEAETLRSQGASGKSPDSIRSGFTEMTDRVTVRASAFLNPNQLDALKGTFTRLSQPERQKK